MFIFSGITACCLVASSTFVSNEPYGSADCFLCGIPSAFVNSAVELYYQLPLQDSEKKIISKIITTMAEKNIVKLGLEKKNLEGKGRQINHVHPLRFIGYIFSDPYLKHCMRQIKKSSFKWDGFINGFSKRMKEEANNGNLIPYVPGLAHLLNVNSEDIINFIYHHDWEGLVSFLSKS